MLYEVITGIPLDLPQGGNQMLIGADKSLRISVSPDGTVYLGTDPVEVPELVGRVVEMRHANPEIGIVISGDRTSAYGAVMAVMGALKDAGIEKVGLETGTSEPPAKQPAKPRR